MLRSRFIARSVCGLHKTLFRSIFIITQETPNENALKFIPGETVLPEGVAEFKTYKEAKRSPLAQQLFRIEGVKNVFFGPDFISVNKDEDSIWGTIKPNVFSAIMEFYASGEPILTDDSQLTDTSINIEEDDEVVQQIKEIIDTRIRPYVQSDGGEITYMGFEDGVVLLKLSGACSGCASSSVTLKNGVEKVLLHYVPEVCSVMTVEEDEVDAINLERFKKVESQINKE